eukprot:Opistho-2@9976
MASPVATYTTTAASSDYDALVVVTDSIDRIRANATSNPSLGIDAVAPALTAARALDAAVGSLVCLIPVNGVCGNRVILSPTGPLSRDYDDVRRFADASAAGVRRAIKAGSRQPLVAVFPFSTHATDPQHQMRLQTLYSRAVEVALLAAQAALHTPLEVVEFDRESIKVRSVGILVGSQSVGERICRCVNAIESGRVVARDIAGSDPERMAPPRVAEYVQKTFEGSCISVGVTTDPEVLRREFPLLAAVARATRGIPRHAACVVDLEYNPPASVASAQPMTTLLLVGKGITYDTGGADVKTGGAMSGMHRDKSGAGAVAGLFKVLSILQPPNLRVIGKLAVVRNSIGSDAYVSDEIIVSRAGVRVRVGNTDAEGRMVMADLLSQLRERAVSENLPNPMLFTIATLTGHAIRAYGPNYTAVVDNGPARISGVHRILSSAGDLWGEPYEVSTLRREDFAFVSPKSEYEDVLQANTLPSTMTDRGHQYPAAFLTIASGLDKHGGDSALPLPYSHVDIAGSGAMWPNIPSASPVVSFSASFILPSVGYV